MKRPLDADLAGEARVSINLLHWKGEVALTEDHAERDTPMSFLTRCTRELVFEVVAELLRVRLAALVRASDIPAAGPLRGLPPGAFPFVRVWNRPLILRLILVLTSGASSGTTTREVHQELEVGQDGVS